MKLIKIVAIAVSSSALWACDKYDKSVDRGIDSKSLTQLKSGIWVDPNGCDHWIIDDGLEGYLSQRLDKYGKPVCSGAAPSNTATGGYKSGKLKGGLFCFNCMNFCPATLRRRIGIGTLRPSNPRRADWPPAP